MLHNRRSIRLKGYDYSQEGIYFITLCCQSRQHLFGKIENGIMHLNEFGEIIKEEWEKTPFIRTNISLGAFIIMPDHFHAILHIDQQITKKEDYIPNQFKSPSQTIGAIIRGFKGATTNRIKKFNSGESKEEGRGESWGVLQYAPTALPSPLKIWQRDYFEKIIRDQRAYQNITQYIIDNPKNWKKKKLSQN